MAKNKIAPDRTPASQAFPFEREIESWKLETAVEKIKPKIERFHRCAQDLAKDLYIAHEALARTGGDRKSENAPDFGWTDFCDMIGLSRKTATLYMRLYDPQTDHVRTPEELTQLRGANVPSIAGFSEERIARAMETGERAAGWTKEDEKEFSRRAANKKFAELAERWGKNKIRWTRKTDRDYFAEAMANAKKFSRFTLETKEQTLAQFSIYDNITQYLRTFDDPGTRLSAAYNLGLKIRDIVNELAANETEMDSFDDVQDETENEAGEA